MKKMLLLSLLATFGASADTINWYGDITGTVSGVPVTIDFTFWLSPADYATLLADEAAAQNGAQFTAPVNFTTTSADPMFDATAQQFNGNWPVYSFASSVADDLFTFTYLSLSDQTLDDIDFFITSGPVDVPGVPEPEWLAGLGLAALIVGRKVQSLAA